MTTPVEWAVVTGASSGIGEAFAKILALQGINVVLVSRDMDELKKVAKKLDSLSIQTEIFAGNLTQSKVVEKLYDFTTQKHINVQYLINNAGFGDYGSFAESDLAKMESMIALNITALTQLTKLYLADMQKQGSGRIVNLASIASFLPGPYMAVYYATKAYVLRFSVALNEELRDSGISVTALCPGPTKTKFASAAKATRSAIFKDNNLPTAQDVAEFGYKAMMARKPVAVHGVRNKIMTSIAGYLPVPLTAKIVRRVQS